MLGSKRNGFGSQQWPDGSSYEGLWVLDRMQGKGCLVSADGSRYFGSF